MRLACIQEQHPLLAGEQLPLRPGAAVRPGAFPMADHHGSTSGRSSPGFGDDPEMMDSSAAFGTPSHLAYSSFSHIGDVQNLSFAVGLREDEEHAELYVQKILPMCKIVPGKPLEKRKRTTQAVDIDVDAIEVPEIIEMRRKGGEKSSSISGMPSPRPSGWNLIL